VKCRPREPAEMAINQGASMDHSELKVDVVTGASQGIGAALVKAYRERNYQVVAAARSIQPSDDPAILTVAGDIAERRKPAYSAGAMMPAPIAPDQDDLTVLTGGMKLSGWQQVRVTAGPELCPRPFDIELTERFPGQPLPPKAAALAGLDLAYRGPGPVGSEVSPS
jgi:hypothetical protein